MWENEYQVQQWADESFTSTPFQYMPLSLACCLILYIEDLSDELMPEMNSRNPAPDEWPWPG